MNEINHAMSMNVDEEVLSRADFNQEDRDWFHKVCMVAAGPASADREDDEEEEKEPRPPAEDATDLMETALGMYPTNVKGGMDAELKKLIMEKTC